MQEEINKNNVWREVIKITAKEALTQGEGYVEQRIRNFRAQTLASLMDKFDSFEIWHGYHTDYPPMAVPCSPQPTSKSWKDALRPDCSCVYQIVCYPKK